MKKLFFSLVLFSLPIMASASTVQVVPNLVNSHGGTATGADMKVCITQGAFKECSADMPTFTLPNAGNYAVEFLPPSGYGYEANYSCPSGTRFDFKQQKEVCSGEPDRAVTCSGTVAQDENKVCHVTYFDGVPVTSVAPISVSTGNVAVPVQTSVKTKSGLTAPQVAAIIGLLEAFGVDAQTVGVVTVILYGN